MNMNLAIVDDNPEELQKLYKTIMDYSCTHDVAIACDRFATSAAFLSACAQISYSFVIFDIYLQDTTGIDLAAEFPDTYRIPDQQSGTSGRCIPGACI